MLAQDRPRQVLISIRRHQHEQLATMRGEAAQAKYFSPIKL